MIDIYEIRHRNVRMLVRQMEKDAGKTGDRPGGLVMLAAKLNKSSAQVAHFASDRPTKRLGDQIAREIEQAFDLEHAWMDWPQWEGTAPSHSQTVRLDPDIVRGVARAMQDTARELKVDLGIKDTVELFAELYSRVGESGITTADVVWLVRRLEQGDSKHAGTGGISDGPRDAAGKVGERGTKG